MKTLIGIVTFGNLPFTELTIESIRASTQSAYDLFVVVGKPGDTETRDWLVFNQISHVIHEENKGFPASINDLYDRAWRIGDYDNLIIAGNDIVPYPDGIDSLIRTARDTDWEWICSSQFDVKSLVDRYPETARYFQGEAMVFTDFTAKPWEIHKDFRAECIEPDVIKDVRNLTLFKPSVMEKIGYADVSFWPGGYFEDNDYCRRAKLAGIKACGLAHSAYFHFWSRTIHQGGKGGEHHEQFRRNQDFYVTKWGGCFEHETMALPFAGRGHELLPGLRLDGTVENFDRSKEKVILDYWASR